MSIIHKCRYCGDTATRWSGVDLYTFDFKNQTLICLGPGYCCDNCDKDNKWIPIGEHRQFEKYIKPKRRRVNTANILSKLKSDNEISETPILETDECEEDGI